MRTAVEGEPTGGQREEPGQGTTRECTGHYERTGETWHDLRVNLFFILLILAVLGLVFAVASGRIAAGFDAPETSVPPRELPPGPVTGADLDGLRFVPALRGYRMDQVDAALDRLREELDRRDAELAELRGGEDGADQGADDQGADDQGVDVEQAPAAPGGIA